MLTRLHERATLTVVTSATAEKAINTCCDPAGWPFKLCWFRQSTFRLETLDVLLGDDCVSPVVLDTLTVQLATLITSSLHD